MGVLSLCSDTNPTLYSVFPLTLSLNLITFDFSWFCFFVIAIRLRFSVIQCAEGDGLPSAMQKEKLPTPLTCGREFYCLGLLLFVFIGYLCCGRVITHFGCQRGSLPLPYG